MCTSAQRSHPATCVPTSQTAAVTDNNTCHTPHCCHPCHPLTHLQRDQTLSIACSAGGTQLTLAWPDLTSWLLRSSTTLTALGVYKQGLAATLDALPTQFPTLEMLFLPYNNLSGALPPSFAMLSKLSALQLSHNNLSGPLPAWLPGSSSSKPLWMDLAYNSFTGKHFHVASRLDTVAKFCVTCLR
jgi:hypothetical protein